MNTSWAEMYAFILAVVACLLVVGVIVYSVMPK